ncbi:GNAT family N-acetyltransferase [Terrabacter sp. NPDC000476]|uniref:GNAT family N-acetyltransferase n=1 Tax=Terrabacter sp. NPDC000476 TaxID=3154258 RepID=UPI00332250A8
MTGPDGTGAPASPGTTSVRIRALAAARQDAALDLVCERQVHASRTDFAWLFTSPHLYDGLVALEAVDPDGRMLGVGFTAHPRYAPPGRAFLRITVARAQERRGVGRALRAELLDRLPPGTTDLVGGVFDDDPRSLAVARHWGFEEVEHAIESVLGLTDLSQPEPPPGVTLHEVPDLVVDDPEAVERMLLASQTNPEAEQGWVFDLAKLRALVAEGETPVGVLARVDGVPVAITFGGVEAGTLSIAYSGVDPAFRGRGLMALVKARAHLVARGVGARSSRASNAEHNEGIREVNRRLGYVVRSGVHRLARTVDAAAAPAPTPSVPPVPSVPPAP